MPRKRQTISGEDAQNIGSVPGQRYGEGVEQQQMQQAMPAPDMSGATPAPPQGVPPAPTGDPQRAPVDPAMIQQYLQANKPDLLAQSQRPDEPVTAGLSTGPGAGPEAIAVGGQSTPLARTLRRLAMDTGNPMFSRLAERAGL